jgi:phage tail tape-measure protein
VRKKFLVSVLALAIAASTSGCAELGINKQQAGTAVGVVAGAVVGQFIGKGNGRIVATLLGSALGGYIGNKIGAKLDEHARCSECLAERLQFARVLDIGTFRRIGGDRSGPRVHPNQNG